MIAYLRGKLIGRSEAAMVIDANGVGYEVFVLTSTLESAPGPGEEVELHIYTHMRDDGISLYGFDRIEEKGMFSLLIGVSGIGPKLAINILSGIPAGELAAALASGDEGRIAAIPGVSGKRAGRLVVELKEKVHAFVQGEAGPASIPEGLKSIADDAVSALVNLGFRQIMAREAVARAMREDDGSELDGVVKRALGHIAR